MTLINQSDLRDIATTARGSEAILVAKVAESVERFAQWADVNTAGWGQVPRGQSDNAAEAAQAACQMLTDWELARHRGNSEDITMAEAVSCTFPITDFLAKQGLDYKPRTQIMTGVGA